MKKLKIEDLKVKSFILADKIMGGVSEDADSTTSCSIEPVCPSAIVQEIN